MSPNESIVDPSANDSSFVPEVVNGQIIKDEDEIITTDQIGPASQTDSQLSGFKPEDLKWGAISDPT